MEFKQAIFIEELDELLHQSPYENVDILPLIEKYTKGKTFNEVSSIRMGVLRRLIFYRDDNLIENGDFQGRISWHPPSVAEHIEEPIYIRSTAKFEDEYKKKRTPAVQPVTNNTVNVDKNFGAIIQDSQFGDLDLRRAENPQYQPKTVQKKNSIVTAIKWIWDIILKHPLVSGIIGAVIAGLILWKVFGIGQP